MSRYTLEMTIDVARAGLRAVTTLSRASMIVKNAIDNNCSTILFGSYKSKKAAIRERENVLLYAAYAYGRDRKKTGPSSDCWVIFG